MPISEVLLTAPRQRFRSLSRAASRGRQNERLNALLTRQVAAATGTDLSKFDIEKYLRALRSAQMAIDLHPERHKHYHLHAVAEQYREHVDVRTFGRSARASE